jgi:uridylate kinase
MARNIVLKIGGSVIYDNLLNINTDLLTKVKDWYVRNKLIYEKMVMVVGGGTLSRDLQAKIANSIGGEEYLHNIGMSVTQTNAALLQGFLGDPTIYIPKKLGDAYEYLYEGSQRTLVSGGLKVGWSTDMDAAVFVDMIDGDIVYKISNIDYLYTEDPKTNPNATPIEDITWGKYFEMFGIKEDTEHGANNSVPIDAECAKFCSQKNISFFLSGGKRIHESKTVEDILSKGTLIHP